MSTWTKRAAVLLPAGVLVAAALWGGNSYLSRKSALDAEIRRYRSGLDERDQEISAGEIKTRRQLSDFANTSLASTGEQVEAMLRTAMNQIVSHVGLDKPKVNTGAPDPRRSPAAGLVREITTKDARLHPDFFVVSATVSGSGTYEQAVRLVALLRQQSFVHRIDELSLRPVGAKRELVEVTVAFSTAFLPDLAPKADPARALWNPDTGQTLSLAAQLAARDPFRPAPDAAPGRPTAVAVAAPDQPPPPDWQITAIVSGVDGPEVWLSDARSGERAILTVKAPVAGVELVSIQTDSATVRAEGKMFVVRLGQSISDRESTIR